MSFKTIFQDTSVGDAIRQYFDTKFAAIESRLESIERMLIEDQRKEAEWHSKETAPDGKLVRITAGGFQVNLIGIKVEPNLWRAWKLNDYSNEVLFIPNVLVYSWRELNIEESAYAWESRILGASEEHAELSTLELPTTKQEPEWRPMSTAPKDCKSIKVKHAKTGEEFFAVFVYGGWTCTKSRYKYKPDTTFRFGDSQLTGWRPL